METEHGARGLRTILGEVPFPADKDRIVDRAADLGADEEQLRALMAMPPVDYGNADEVMRSVPMDESETDARIPEARRHQRHEQTRSGQAETMKETRPVNPIEEEIGENRKE
ncbi:DUF2795 domain-containing protein [Nocardiopsis aegyptia]|uniref:DUF2795 domain-containing protein n=1 Tax=Nocardiopsis aegyptia TaxID=220378 RepID=A0A7Z0EKI9_9ACTN|nr:DUF2795 domain-containing protein [Nocardiopsis aegyptia]NYJ32983.1 hypothetical protein [Nocardiopsis aegyptia]